MIGSSIRGRASATRAAVLLAALVLAIAAFGCGSGGDTTSTQTTAEGSTTAGVTNSGTGSGAAPQDRAGHAGGDGNPAAETGKGSPKSGSTGGGDRAGDPATGGGETGQRAAKRHAAIAAEAAKHCPAGTDLAQCKALVEGAKQSKNSRSFEVKEPKDCLEAMGQAECEATYTAQKEAAEAAGESVDVQACLKNPTPKCEAILRPFLEQQRAAEEAGR